MIGYLVHQNCKTYASLSQQKLKNLSRFFFFHLRVPIDVHISIGPIILRYVPYTYLCTYVWCSNGFTRGTKMF